MAMIQNSSGQSLVRPLVPGMIRTMDRVMCVDDGAVDQMLYKRVISRSGLAREIVGHTLPEDALAELTDADGAQVDLVLLDVNMPRMNGFEFLEAAQDAVDIATLPPVIVMLTTPLSAAHRAQAATLDTIRGYLPKPLQVDGLRDMINAIQSGA